MLLQTLPLITAYASFSAAIDGIGATNKTLLISNQQAVTANKTVPANITLAFLRSGSLNISADVTVTINGPLEAGLHQIFAGAGAVSLGSPGEVYPQWWGATADGTTDDSSEIQAAIDAGGIRIVFPKGTYNIGSTTINLKGGIHLIGQGGIIPVHYSGDGAAFTNGSGGSAAISDVKMENFEIRHIGANTNAICLDIHDFYVSVFNNIYITKLSGEDANWDVGIQLRATFWGTYWNNISAFFIYYCNTGIKFKDEAAAVACGNFISGGVIHSCTTGIDIEAGGQNSNMISDIDFEACTTAVDDKGLTNQFRGFRMQGGGSVPLSITTTGYPAFLPDSLSGYSTSDTIRINNTTQQVTSYNNLVFNGDFDIWTDGVIAKPTGWPNGSASGISKGSVVPFSGNSVALTRSGSDVTLGQTIAVETNTWYTFVGWQKSDNGSVNAMLNICDVTAAHDFVADNWTTASWRKVVRIFNTGGYSSILVRFLALTNNGDAYFDRVALYKGFMPRADYNPHHLDYVLGGTDLSKKQCWTSTAPTAGTWAVGDIVWNTTPSGNVGWVCVTAGTPGTWLSFGLIKLVNYDTTWDPPSISTGRETSKEVTVTGAEINDTVLVSFEQDVQDLVLDAQVTAANTVTCVLSNTTGASVNLASGALYVMVIKK